MGETLHFGSLKPVETLQIYIYVYIYIRDKPSIGAGFLPSTVCSKPTSLPFFLRAVF